MCDRYLVLLPSWACAPPLLPLGYARHRCSLRGTRGVAAPIRGRVPFCCVVQKWKCRVVSGFSFVSASSERANIMRLGAVPMKRCASKFFFISKRDGDFFGGGGGVER